MLLLSRLPHFYVSLLCEALARFTHQELFALHCVVTRAYFRDLSQNPFPRQTVQARPAGVLALSMSRTQKMACDNTKRAAEFLVPHGHYRLPCGLTFTFEPDKRALAPAP